MQWYHITNEWSEQSVVVKPRIGRVDDDNDPREMIPFIEVAPTIQQCIVALGVWRDYALISKSTPIRVYRAHSEENPEPAEHVFDFDLTSEHRFREVTLFSRVGVLDLFSIDNLIKHRDLSHENTQVILKRARADLIELRLLDIEKFLDRTR